MVFVSVNSVIYTRWCFNTYKNYIYVKIYVLGIDVKTLTFVKYRPLCTYGDLVKNDIVYTIYAVIVVFDPKNGNYVAQNYTMWIYVHETMKQVA